MLNFKPEVCVEKKGSARWYLTVLTARAHRRIDAGSANFLHFAKSIPSHIQLTGITRKAQLGKRSECTVALINVADKTR